VNRSASQPPEIKMRETIRTDNHLRTTAQLSIRHGVSVHTSHTSLMPRKSSSLDESWESDAVWQLLDQVPPPKAGPRFVNDTLRAIRLAEKKKPWWSRFWSPAPIAGLAAACAAMAFALITLLEIPDHDESLTNTADHSQTATIQEIAETETLIAAADHLDDFSDTELVSLIGF